MSHLVRWGGRVGVTVEVGGRVGVRVGVRVWVGVRARVKGWPTEPTAFPNTPGLGSS